MYFFWNFSSQYVISAFLGLQKHILGFGRKALSHQLVVYKSPLNVGVIQVNFSSYVSKSILQISSNFAALKRN